MDLARDSARTMKAHATPEWGPVPVMTNSQPTAPDSDERQDHDEEFWRRFLEEGGDTWKGIGRRILKRIPSSPRCRMCAAPFAGPGAPAMRLIGKRPSEANPSWCTSCFNYMSKHHGGAEIDGAMLFADIRGSTSLAERMTPGEYRALLDRFYTTATSAVFRWDGFVDKFVGDELVALFFPLLTGERFTARAVACAKDLLCSTGHADPGGPWVPVGVGVHAGRAWFGVVGDESHLEMTAVGDAVNVAARLASVAQAGEVLVSTDTAAASDLDVEAFPRRVLELRGKERATEVISIVVRPA
jgi:adenylate cyclase